MMIALLIALSSVEATAAPEGPYIDCLRHHAGPGPVDRAVAVERTRMAIEQCRDRREALVRWAVDQFRKAGADHPEESAERAAILVENVFPASLVDASAGPVRIVPERRCASELEVRDGCLE